MKPLAILIAVLLSLAACTDTGSSGAQPGDVIAAGTTGTPSGVGMIEIVRTTAGGEEKTEIFPNDAAHVTLRPAGGGTPVISRTTLAAGSYARTRALVEARMPGIGAGASGCAAPTQASVYVEPAIGGRNEVSAQCPGPVHDLQGAILQAIGR